MDTVLIETPNIAKISVALPDCIIIDGTLRNLVWNYYKFNFLMHRGKGQYQLNGQWYHNFNN